ncbi:MAG: GGDEF domain-containing protein [Methylophilaceae bacterium]|nr:GGDEF domain-containing protein [Methylophilaceae bacterium]
MSTEGNYVKAITTPNREFEISYSAANLLLKAQQFSLDAQDISGKFVVDSPKILHITNELATQQNNQYLQDFVEVLLGWQSSLNEQEFTKKINKIINLWINAVDENTHIDIILDLIRCIGLYKKFSIFSFNTHTQNFQLFLFSLVTETIALHQETKLDYTLNHDAQTNLPNTNMMLHKLTHCLNASLKSDGEHTIGLMSVSFEIEKLTSILIQLLSQSLNVTIATLIQEALPKGASLYQMSNMQFAIVIENLSNNVQLNLLATKIQRIFEQVLVIDNKSLRAIPIVCCTYVEKNEILKSKTTAQSLLQNIGIALESALTTHRNFVMYSLKIFDAIETQKQIELEVIDAFNNNNLTLYFQPIANLPDESCAGAEVLLRCPQTLSLGIHPAMVIDVINKVGLGEQFTRWLINSTCRLANELIHQHHLPIYLTFNLRVEDLHNVELPHLLTQSMTMWNLDANDLILEITENGILEENDKTTDNINQLAALGFKLALDDFGTGYSSLARLRSMPISLIKIDQSFVRNIARSIEDYEIVKSISLLAASLGKEVLVEGVEDIDCLNLIKGLNFKKVQGYYFSKPLPFDEFVEWAKAHPQRMLASAIA